MLTKSRTLFLVLACFFAAAPSFSEVVLVYENRDAVLKSEFTIGSVVPEGTVVEAKPSLIASTSPLVGMVGEDLYEATLLRLDNDVKLVVLKVGARVSDVRLLAAHRARAGAVARFIPPTSQGIVANPFSTGPQIPHDPFAVKINGTDVDQSTITIQLKSGFPKCVIEVVNTSSTSFWNGGFDLESDPKLAFWQKGKEMHAADRPMEKYTYSYQFLIVPMKEGKSYAIPLDVYRVKEGTYQWKFKVKAKDVVLEKTATVVFVK